MEEDRRKTFSARIKRKKLECVVPEYNPFIEEQSEDSSLREIYVKEEPLPERIVNDVDNLVHNPSKVMNQLDTPIINLQNVNCSSGMSSAQKAHKPAPHPIHIPSNNVREYIQMNYCYQSFETAVIALLVKINEDVTDIKKRQDDIIDFLLDKKIVSNSESFNFGSKYNLMLPFQTMETFLRFDETLKENFLMKADLCAELRTMLDKNYSITKSIVCILKKFFMKNLAMQFTTVRKSKTSDTSKKQFKHTELCKCIDAVIMSERKAKGMQTSDSDLVSGLSDVICNAKNWYKNK